VSLPRAPLGEVDSWRWSAVSLAGCLGLLATVARIGGDWDWLVALGFHIRETGSVPDHVPFATADSSGWHDVPVLSQLLASLLRDVSGRSAVVAHLVLVVMALVVLAIVARGRGASDRYVASALALVCLGSLPTLGIVRAQTWSLVPFALILALVVQQTRTPDRRIWWSVPLVLVWGNLHGAALLGVCVLGAYLVVERIRTRFWESVAVGTSALLALCATPQLWNTPRYYVEVFANVSAQRAEGLWARPSLTMPFDVAMLVAAVVLLAVLLRARRHTWEYVACLGLCVATVSAARHGVWLLFVLAVIAAGPPTRSAPSLIGDSPRGRGALLTAGAAMAVALPVLVVRGESVLGASPAVVESVKDVAGSGVVLAPAPLSEALAVSGVTLWAGNPLDAFDHDVQAAYLDFLAARPEAQPAIDASDVVVVRDGSSQEGLVQGDASFEAVACGEGWTCYVRT
jgi:hypothetical protein